jgi:hypothetical protein
MDKILREPLLHFLLLGAVIFTVYGWVSNPSRDKPAEIVITQGQVASMVDGFTRTWQRPPTRDELQGLVRDRVREEVYYREAIALGLDKDDIIVRRRLRQKMEFVTDDVVAEAEPTEEELGSYLKMHPDSFRLSQLFTFSQVFLNPQLHGEHLAHDTSQLLAQLNKAGSAADVSVLGDSFLLDHTFDALPAGEVTKLFGENFATKLGGISPGQWQGPIESGYGLHLVFVSARTEGRLPALNDIRDAVQREWANTRRLEANEQFYRELLKRYTVTVERPDPSVGQQKLAVAE